MLCEDIKHWLSSYLDDALALPARVALEDHLKRCPLCRDELAELRSLTRSLRVMSIPSPPGNLASSITQALIIEAAARRQSPQPPFAVRLAAWLEPRLMPYSVGSLASIILFVAMFVALRPHFVALREAAAQSAGVYLINSDTGPDLRQPVTPEDYSASRAPFGAQSPSLNPTGALAMLNRSYGRGDTRYQDADDMIVVADVFSNGAASLVDVVQAPRNRQMLSEFETAIRQDAVFVPASLDRRPDTMRVVFSVQKVDVRDQNF